MLSVSEKPDLQPCNIEYIDLYRTGCVFVQMFMFGKSHKENLNEYHDPGGCDIRIRFDEVKFNSYCS